MKIKKSFYSIIFPLSLLFLHTIVCSDNIRVEGSYKSKKLICNEFRIDYGCTINGNVKADQGYVGYSMKAKNIVMKLLKVCYSLKATNLECNEFRIGYGCTINGNVKAGQGYVGYSLQATNLECNEFQIGHDCTINGNVKAGQGYVGYSLQAANLECNKFQIGHDCTINGNVKAGQGCVNYSMTAQNIDLKESLEVGQCLKGEALVCPKFKVYSDCIINGNVTGQEGSVGGTMTVHNIELQKYLNVLGSLTVHGQGRMSDLTVGQSLSCLNTIVANLTQVGNVIQAKNSNFNKVCMKDSRKSSVNQSFVHSGDTLSGRTVINNVSINGGNNNFMSVNCSAVILGSNVVSGGSSVNIGWSSNIGNIVASGGSSVNIGWPSSNVGNIVASGGSSVNIGWSSNVGNIVASGGSSVNIGWSPTFYLSYVYAFVYYMSKKIMSLFWGVLVSQGLTFLDDREISRFCERNLKK